MHTQHTLSRTVVVKNRKKRRESIKKKYKVNQFYLLLFWDKKYFPFLYGSNALSLKLMYVHLF